MLFAVGAGPQVVAVSSFDEYPPEVKNLQRVGALLDPDLERILSLRPDLVAVYGSQQDLMTQLARAGIPVYSYRHAGLADVNRTIREIGDRVGHAAGSRGARQEDRRADGRRSASASPARPRPRTLLVFGREIGALRGIYASGGIGFLHDMLEAAGGEDVFADVKRESVQATTELILARKPDVILEIRSGTGRSGRRLPSEIAVWRALASVPAVRNGRVHFIVDPRTVVPGPRVAEATELLARALHPEAFEEHQLRSSQLASGQLPRASLACASRFRLKIGSYGESELDGVQSQLLARELDRHALRDQALVERVGHQPLEALAAALAVRQRQVVDVHADEGVGARAVEAAAELQRVLDRLLAVRQRVRDAVVQQLRDLGDHLRPEVAPDDVAAERQRQPAGALGPPLAEIDDLPQPFVLIRQLALVDQQAGLGAAVEHRLTDLVERHDDVLEVRFVDPQRQVGGRQRARNRDAAALDRGRAVLRARPRSGRTCRPCSRRAAAARTCRAGARRRGRTPPSPRSARRTPRG